MRSTRRFRWHICTLTHTSYWTVAVLLLRFARRKRNYFIFLGKTNDEITVHRQCCDETDVDERIFPTIECRDDVSSIFYASFWFGCLFSVTYSKHPWNGYRIVDTFKSPHVHRVTEWMKSDYIRFAQSRYLSK